MATGQASSNAATAQAVPEAARVAIQAINTAKMTRSQNVGARLG